MRSPLEGGMEQRKPAIKCAQNEGFVWTLIGIPASHNQSFMIENERHGFCLVSFGVGNRQRTLQRRTSFFKHFFGSIFGGNHVERFLEHCAATAGIVSYRPDVAIQCWYDSVLGAAVFKGWNWYSIDILYREECIQSEHAFKWELEVLVIFFELWKMLAIGLYFRKAV